MLFRVGIAVSAALAMLVSGYAPRAAADNAPRAQIAPWGLDLSDRDTSVKPGDDFYRYADGRAWAQVWRGLTREEQLGSQVISNPHSPNHYRVNGVVRNVDAWYQAFDVQPGDKLYLPPAERVHIW